VYVRKNNKKFNIAYPEEKEGKLKDANKKLKSQVRNLQKKIKQLESHNDTIYRAYNKSCDFIQHKLSDKSLEEVLNIVNTYSEKGTKKQKSKTVSGDKCQQCGNVVGEGYTSFSVGKFKIESCSCGHRRKTETSEGIERS